MSCGFGMQNDRDPRECRRNLFEQLQPFSGHRQLEIGQARDIAARPCQALNEAAADRIGDLHENDGYRASLLQHCRHYWITVS